MMKIVNNGLKNEQIRKVDNFLFIVCSVCIFAVTFYITSKLTLNDNTDYFFHTSSAIKFKEKAFTSLTYPLWHFIVFIFSNTFLSSENASAFVSALINTVLYLILVKIFRNTKIRLPEIIAFVLSFVTAIYIPFYNSNIYLGQGSPNIWHNPTNLMVKPFALVAFFLIVKICNNIKNTKCQKKEYILLMVLMTFSVLAKPSFFQGIVPALGVYIVINLVIYKFKNIKQFLFLCVAFVPSFLVVVYQYYVSFVTSDGAGGIGIGWFVAKSIFSPNPWISLLLVIAFPLIYLILNVKKLKSETDLQLAWLLFVVTWLMGSLLYETGPRMNDGNFGWALQLAYYILFVVSAKNLFCEKVFLNSMEKKQLFKRVLLILVLSAHFVSGIMYVYYFITIPSFVI